MSELRPTPAPTSLPRTLSRRDVNRLIGLSLAASVTASALDLLRPPPAAAAVSELLPNPGFETVANGVPTDWTIVGTGTVRSATSPVHSAKYSVFLDDQSSQAGLLLRSSRVPVTPGHVYTAEVWALVESGRAALYLEFWNGANTRIHVNQLVSGPTTDWKLLSTVGVAPDEATRATVGCYIPYADIGSTYFDDASLHEPDGGTVQQFPLLVPGHPRLYFTAADVPGLRAKATDTRPTLAGPAGADIWATLSALADTYVAESSFTVGYIGGVTITYQLPPQQPAYHAPPPGFTGGPYPYWTALGKGIEDRVETMALAYAVTGERKYADRVREYLLALAEWDVWSDPAFTTQLTSLDTASIVFAVAFGYDMVYDLLTPEERSTVAAALDHKGLARLWAESIDPADNNIAMVRAASLGAGATVVLEENADTDKYLSTVIDDFSWYLEQRRTTGTQEGFFYTSFAMDHVLKSADLIRRVTGVDQLLTDPYVDESKAGDGPNLVHWVLHSLVPGLSSAAPISDSLASNYFPITESVLVTQLGDAHAGWLLANTKPDDTSFDQFIYTPIEGPVEGPSDLDRCVVIPGVGWASIRTGWTEDDTLFLLVANDSKLGHNHHDQNSFLIGTNNNWVAGDPGYRDYLNSPTNLFTTTYGHSTLYVDGKAQSQLGGGSLAHGVLSDQCAYVVGDAAQAYQDPELSCFRRHVVAVPGEYYFIYDDIAAPAAHTYQWSMFNGAGCAYTLDGEPMQLGSHRDGRQCRVTNQSAQLCLSFLGDATPDVVVESYPGAESYGPMTRVSSGTPATTAAFSTIIQAAPYRVPGMYQAEALYSSVEAGGLVTRTLGIGPATVVFVRSAEPGDHLTLTFDVAAAGTYDLRAWFGMSPAYGQVQVSIDGDPVGGPQDCYASAATITDPIPLGSVDLAGGSHTITLTCAGKNPASSGYYMSLDAFQLTPSGQPVTPSLIDAVSAEAISSDTAVGAIVDRDSDNGVRDLIGIRTVGSRLVLRGCRTDGTQLLVSTDADGSVQRYAASAATELTDQSQLLLRADHPVDVGALFRGGVMSTTVTASANTRLSLYSRVVGTVTLEGAGIPTSVDPHTQLLTLTIPSGTHRISVERQG